MRNISGFSLFELLIVLAIVSILTVITYPTYSSYVTRVRRANAAVAVLDLAARMEQYYENHNSYLGATTQKLGVKNNLDNFYILEINKESATTYLLEAMPINAQAKAGQNCGSLILDQLGHKMITGKGGVDECWR